MPEGITFPPAHQSIYVNLFIGSEVDWKEKGVRLVQDTNFPEEEGTMLTFKAAKATPLTLKIRIPYWATEGVQIKLNSKIEKVAAVPSRYAEIRRMWHDGDKVEVTLPMRLHTAPLPDDQTLQAAMYGPLVLAAEMGRDGLTEHMIYGDYGPDERHKSVPMPEVSAVASNPTGWLEKSPHGGLKFQTVGQSQQMSLIPLYKLLDQHYSVYWKVKLKAEQG